jgi:iron complex outermembrane recepter protein
MTPLLRPVFAVLLASAAFADPAPQPPPPVRVATVVVQETPLTSDASGVSTIQFDETMPMSTREFAGLSDRVSNLHIADGGAGSFGNLITLRGLPNTPYFSDPSVTLYFDDIPLGSVFSYPTGLFGFANAMIARGPQGSASGRGGEAGAIYLSSAEPSSQSAGELRMGGGNFDERFASFDARTARGSKADAAVAGAWLARDGYIRNTTLGIRLDHRNESSVSARLRLRPTDTIEITLQLLGERHRDGAQPLVPISGRLFTVARGREGSTDSDFGGIALKVAADTSVGRLSTTTSHTEWTLNPYDNRLTLPPTLDSHLTQAQRAWNEELRLASDPKSIVVWHAGAWFSDAATHGNANRGVVLPFGTVPAEVSNFALTSRTSALFGELTVPPAFGWKITGGLRLEETKKNFQRGQQVPGSGYFVGRKTYDFALPKVAASYGFASGLNATASVAYGAKPGGWSAYTANPALAAFRPERMLATEAGLDTTLLQDAVTLAARVFDYEIRDYQIERSFNAADYLVVNAPRARSRGGEIEAVWHAARALTVTASVGITDVRLIEFTDPFSHRSFDGNRAPYAPDYDASLSATWHARSGFFAAFGGTAAGKMFFEESQDNTFAARAHVVVSARAGYETPRWRVTAFGENLGDAGYTTLVIPGVRHAAPGAPRTWGVEAAVKW